MNLKTAETVAWWIGQRHLLKAAQAFTRKNELSVAQMVLMLDMANSGSVYPAEQIRETGVSRGYLYQMLGNLADRGLCYRVPNSGKLQPYALSESGLDIVEQLSEHLGEADDLARFASSLPDDLSARERARRIAKFKTERTEAA